MGKSVNQKGNRRTGHPAQQGHDELEQSEGERKAQNRAPGSLSGSGTGGDRHRKGVHPQTKRQKKYSYQTHLDQRSLDLNKRLLYNHRARQK